MEKRQSERLYTGTIRTGAAQALQENLQNSKSTKEAESLWEYATTPQLPKFTNDRTPPYISSSIKKDAYGLLFNPIAVTGMPYSKESGVKLVSPEEYDLIMDERGLQNNVYKDAKNYDKYLAENHLEEYKVTDKWSAQDREKVYSLFKKSPNKALNFAKSVNTSLDKRAENVKIKAEDSGKSSYDQVIDELAEALKSQKGYTALSFWDKLSDRVSTANGSDKQSLNTVSSSDPVGTSGEEKVYSTEKTIFVKQMIKQLSSSNSNINMKGLFKTLENTLLKALSNNDDSIFDWIFKTPDHYIDFYYEYNSKNDIKNTIINNQSVKNSAISKLSLNGTSMSNNGCEVIAVNNAMTLMGYKTSVAGIVRTFQKNDVVIGNTILSGYFGSNPYALDRVFRDYHVNYETVSYSELSERGLYVISFWNNDDYDSMLHTIAMQSDGKGNYITYNNSYDDVDYEFPISDEKIYIIGYRLTPDYNYLSLPKI